MNVAPLCSCGSINDQPNLRRNWFTFLNHNKPLRATWRGLRTESLGLEGGGNKERDKRTQNMKATGKIMKEMKSLTLTGGKKEVVDAKEIKSIPTYS